MPACWKSGKVEGSCLRTEVLCCPAVASPEAAGCTSQPAERGATEEGRTGACEPRNAYVAKEHAAREVELTQALQAAQLADDRQAPRQAQARRQRERGERGQGRDVVHERRPHPLARQVLANTLFKVG